MDGDLRTAWTTGPIEDGRWGQHPGQWFVLDFGTPQFVSRIVLEHQGTETFYISSWPREVRASVSADGAEWEEVEATPAGPLQPLLLEFEPARRVQALRLELLAEHQPECWDLHEVHVFAPAPRPGPTRK
jgi:hypothetical protein